MEKYEVDYSESSYFIFNTNNAISPNNNKVKKSYLSKDNNLLTNEKLQE